MTEFLSNAVRVRTRLPLIQQDGKTVTTNIIYVRSDRALPKVGDFVLAESETNHEQFPGVVTQVHSIRHGYVARIDLS